MENVRISDGRACLYNIKKRKILGIWDSGNRDPLPKCAVPLLSAMGKDIEPRAGCHIGPGNRGVAAERARERER